MKTLGFLQGKTTPCVFWRPNRDLRTSVHGDNFASLGARLDCDWFESVLKKEFVIKVEGIFGPPGTPDCVHSIRSLNRLLTWTSEGIEWESDPRRVQLVVREMGVAASTAKVATPGIKDKPGDEDQEEVPIDDSQVRWHRSLCMRIAYIAQDRPDLSVVTRELAKGAKRPMQHHVELLKRVARYLRSSPRLTQRFDRQEEWLRLLDGATQTMQVASGLESPLQEAYS